VRDSCGRALALSNDVSVIEDMCRQLP
jgi:hypothetical protein